MNIQGKVIKYAFDVAGGGTPKESYLTDLTWLQKSPSTPLAGFTSNETQHLYNTIAKYGVLDTSFGGHVTVNPPYGFTTFADLPHKGRLIGRERDTAERQPLNVGMGRYYSEAIDDNAKMRTLILTFGVPKFKSFLSFYMYAVDYGKLIAARGESLIFYNIGKAAGFALMGAGAIGMRGVAFFRYSWLMIGLTAISVLRDLIGGVSDPKYYSMSPRMHSYLQTANNILANLVADRGIVPLVLQKPGKGKRYGSMVGFDKDDIAELHKLVPHLFTGDGFISLPALLARPQRILNEQIALERKVLNGNSKLMTANELTVEEVKKIKEELNNGIKAVDVLDFNKVVDELNGLELLKNKRTREEVKTIGEMSDNITGLDNKQTSDNATTAEPIDTLSSPTGANTPKDISFEDRKPTEDGLYVRDDEDWKDNISYLREMYAYEKVIIKNGLDNVAFQVEYLGQTTDTFSNSFKEIPVKGAINTISSTVRDVRYTLSDLNIIDGTIDSVIKSARDVVMGGADSVTAGLSNVLAATLMGAFLDFPDVWDDSDTQLATHSYKIVLGGPYGGDLSLMHDIDVPLSLILSAVLPKSVGRSSYSEPFLCSAYMRGYTNVGLGMFKNVSITRATGNMPFNRHAQSTQLEITFDLMDLSTMVSGATSDGIMGALDIAADEYSKLNQYISSIAGVSYTNQKFLSKKFLRSASATLFGTSAALSPEFMATRLSENNLAVEIASAITSVESTVDMFDN